MIVLGLSMNGIKSHVSAAAEAAATERKSVGRDAGTSHDNRINGVRDFVDKRTPS